MICFLYWFSLTISNNNPRLFLKSCSAFCKNRHEQSSKTIETFTLFLHVQQFFLHPPKSPPNLPQRLKKHFQSIDFSSNILAHSSYSNRSNNHEIRLLPIWMPATCVPYSLNLCILCRFYNKKQFGNWIDDEKRHFHFLCLNVRWHWKSFFFFGWLLLAPCALPSHSLIDIPKNKNFWRLTECLICIWAGKILIKNFLSTFCVVWEAPKKILTHLSFVSLSSGTGDDDLDIDISSR